MRRSSQHMAGLCCVDSSVFVFAVMVKQSLNITTLKRVLVLLNSSTFLRNTSSTPSPTSSSTTSTMPQVGNTLPSATMHSLIDCQTKTEMTLQNVHNWFLVTQKFYLLFSGIHPPIQSMQRSQTYFTHVFLTGNVLWWFWNVASGLVARLRYPGGKNSAPPTAGFSYGESCHTLVDGSPKMKRRRPHLCVTTMQTSGR